MNKEGRKMWHPNKVLSWYVMRGGRKSIRYYRGMS